MASFNQLWVLTKRILRQNFTDADTLTTVIAMPVFLLLFFVYVLGGNVAIGAHGSTLAYLNYALPGFLLLTMTMGAAYTSLRINNDKLTGMLDRLHSLPIKRWVILGAHTVASVIFMLITELVVLLVGLIMGYRPDLTIGSALLVLLLSVLFALGITLMAIPFSLKANGFAGAGAFSYVLMMLLMVSSALMPVKGMATPVRLFAEHQPMTAIVDAARNLFAGRIVGATIWQAGVWLIGLILVFGLMSRQRYHKIFLNQ
ncbi:ABC transporter permease [Lapidilactobacillus bayanensis]|uniref:ABC transporter permease n=1 Tax=Lapidilactobacillus bayanensis TaxID=2485998 RepID=UPI000F7A13E4|nr:ABC transporter permease [Lapidilactobacillus bayanensis]